MFLKMIRKNKEDKDALAPQATLIPMRWLIVGGFVVLVMIALVIRIKFINFQSMDYQFFLVHWFAYIHEHGFSAFSSNFSNYNLPYLYLMYVADVLGIPDIIAVKGISIVFDFILAYSIYLVVRHFNPKGLLPYAAGIITLFLPTVMLNGSFWGQCDAIYASFIVFSLYSALKNRQIAMWIFWGIAITFKLQAAFFLPFLVYIWLTRTNKQWWAPIVSIPVFFLPFIPALIAGRSFNSILSIYRDQTGISSLVANAPSLYQWIPAQFYDYFNATGVLLTAAIVILIGLFALIYRRFNDKGLLLFATALLFTIPFFLPQMHERYFFLAEIFAFILAFSIQNRKFLLIAVIAQLVGFLAYTPFLFGLIIPVISLPQLSLVQLGVVLTLLYWSLLDNKNKKTLSAIKFTT